MITSFLASVLLYGAYAMFVVLGFIAVVLSYLDAKDQEERGCLFGDNVIPFPAKAKNRKAA
jgi:hypothetical protein